MDVERVRFIRRRYVRNMSKNNIPLIINAIIFLVLGMIYIEKNKDIQGMLWFLLFSIQLVIIKLNEIKDAIEKDKK